MTPNPGSQAAIDAGCTCPVLDNHHGAGIPWPGYDEPQFWISENCPIHGQKIGKISPGGFSEKKMLQGETDARAGRTHPLADVINEIRRNQDEETQERQ